MRMPRVRFTVRRAMTATVIVGVVMSSGRSMGFNDWSHVHRHRAHRCGCEYMYRFDSELSWPGLCLEAYHLGLAALYDFCSAVYGQPHKDCRVPILDPIRGGSVP